MRAGPWLLLCLLSCHSGNEEPRPENLLLVTLDTVRADRVGFQGGREGVTPALDRLAERGTHFAEAWAPRSQTWPTLATVLTGRLPLTHGVRENGLALPPGVPALPALFGRGGIRSGAFLSNACEAWGTGRFDRLLCSRGPGEERGDQSRLQHRWDARAVEEALAWIDADEAPFFAWVHLYDAHKPFPTIERHRARHLDPAYGGSLRTEPSEVARGDRMALHALLDELALEGSSPAGADLAALLAYYDGGLSSVDENLDALARGLEARGRLEETLLVVTSDHGEELFDHHHYPYHSAAISRSSLRVPLLFVWEAGLPRGLRVDAPVGLEDLAPTLLELFDLPRPATLDGESLVPAFAGALPERELLSELVVLDWESGLPRFEDELFALRAGRWRLVWNPKELRVRRPPYTRGDHPGLLHPTALYDLEKDPEERFDRSAQEPERVRVLRDRLEAKLAALEVRRTTAQPPRPETLEVLRGLGYVDDE